MVETRYRKFFSWILLHQLLIINGIDITPAKPKKFDTVVLSTNASGLTSVLWSKDTATLTTCFVGPGICPSADVLPGALIEINTATVESTITIGSVNQTFHGGKYEATSSSAVDVLVNTLPTTVNWTAQPQGNLTSVSSVEWIAKIYCVYPASDINVHFTVYVEGVQEDAPRSPTLSIEPDSNCDSPEETVVATLSLSPSNFQNQKVYIIANASHASFPTEPSVSSGQTADAIFQGPTTQTSTILLTEGITTNTNYINEYSNTNVPLTSETVTPSNVISETVTPSNVISETVTPSNVISETVTPSNVISEIITPTSLGNVSTIVFDAEIPNSTLVSMNSGNSLNFTNSSEMTDITISHFSSILFTSTVLHTVITWFSAHGASTFYMSNMFLSSFDSLSSQTHSRTILITSFLETSDIKSNTLFSITGVLSDSSSKLPIVLLTSISTSSFKLYSTPLSTFAVEISTNDLLGSTFENTDYIVDRKSVLTYHTTTDMLTSYTSNSGIVSETEITYTRSYRTSEYDQNAISDSVWIATNSYVSSEFHSQTFRTTQTIISIDTLMRATESGGTDTMSCSRVLQTYTPASTASIFSKHPFPSEIYNLSTISLPGMTLKTALLESSIYSSSIEDDIMTTDVHSSGFLSIDLSQSIGTSISMKTSSSLVTTSILASNPTTEKSQMFMSGYLQSSVDPTEQDFLSRSNEYFLTTVQATKSIQVSSTEINPSIVKSIITVSETQSSVYTEQNTEMLTIKDSSFIKTIIPMLNLGTTEVASKSERGLSTPNHSFLRTTTVTSLTTAQYTLQSSYFSLLDNSDNPKVIVSASMPDSSSVAFIPKIVYSSSSTKTGLRETTKNVIFITTMSGVAVLIITVSSIMLLRMVVLIKRKRTLEMKAVDASFSNDAQSVRKVFPEFPYTERSIYPRFSNPLSTFTKSPYEHNWNEV